MDEIAENLKNLPAKKICPSSKPTEKVNISTFCSLPEQINGIEPIKIRCGFTGTVSVSETRIVSKTPCSLTKLIVSVQGVD
jgi:hypothetical protein